MKAVRATIDRVAASGAPCSSRASIGTARKSSRACCIDCPERAARPLVTMNAGGLSEGRRRVGTLFGHVKGAFTDARQDRIGCFELADEGTLFLDGSRTCR
jgi:transcriptional regulator with GAF, ATPase, and Fis domain